MTYKIWKKLSKWMNEEINPKVNEKTSKYMRGEWGNEIISKKVVNFNKWIIPFDLHFCNINESMTVF